MKRQLFIQLVLEEQVMHTAHCKEINASQLQNAIRIMDRFTHGAVARAIRDCDAPDDILRDKYSKP